MTRRLLLACALIGAALCAAPPAHAQSGAVGASAVVVFPPLTGTGVRGLQFGRVIPSAGSVTVRPSSALAGEWRLTSMRGRKWVDITFILPAALQGPGGATLPLSFNGNFAALCEIDDATQICQTASYFEWNPVTTPTYRDTPERYKPGRPRYSDDSYSIYIGGIATPAPAQPAGQYTGAVGITIVTN
ncbi:MAG: hypothetical protein AVDCRST_MAG68-271 [uncultured Gemmatimonadetes bacterium]|uniref:Secreted protein n=1 Tax=uncultured Gemmatimonadota bacterium TaxID=203437 RepID=A0A6J4K589_9BACT|nr:MAG: hypothetical protein AVDCRST_MAG68-271 [uncultured Gemmatimonadota bacterium]